MKEGWTYKKLGDVGTFLRGGGFLKRDYVENGIPCIHYGQIHTILGTITKKHITSIPETLRDKTRFASKGDIIFAITSEDVEGSCKCTAWLGDYDVAVGGHAAIYKHSLYPAYVSYFAKSSLFYKQKEKYVHGFKVMEIKPSDIAQIEIPVPPLSEQQRIVERLDAAFAHIDELKAKADKQLSEARALFQSSLEETMKPKEGWEEKTLGDIAVFSQGIQVDVKLQTEICSPGKVRFLRIIDVTQGNVPPRYIDDPGERYYLKADEIAMVRYGTVGFVCYGFEGVIANNLFKVSIKDKSKLQNNYLQYFLKSNLFQSHIRKGAGGAALPAIKFGDIKNVLLGLPPLSDQQRIVERLDALSEHVRALEENQRKVMTECDALKQAILREVFE